MNTIIKRIRISPLFFLLGGILSVLIGLSFVTLRLDLSKGSIFTLAPATKKIIRAVDNTVTLQFFASSDLPTRILPLKTDVYELLQEYRKGSGKIKVSVVDPKKDQKMADKAKEYGIPELQFSQLEQNKYQVSSSYFGIAILYKEKKEIIPQVTDFSNLEYTITSAIYRLTKKELPKIGIVGIPDSYDPNTDPIFNFKRTLAQQYTLVTLDLKTITEDQIDSFTKEYKTIYVFNNGTQQYEEPEINILKGYFVKGGNLIIFSDGVILNEETLTTQTSTSALNVFTATYGATINQNYVLSALSEFVNFGNQMFQFQVAYPFWIRTSEFNQKSGFFTNISSLTFPWASSLTVKNTNNTTATLLIRSSRGSWTQTDPFNLNPETIPQPKESDLKESVLTSLISYNKGGKLLVIPSSRFIFDRYLGRANSNVDFMLNITDSFSSGGALSGIRSRSATFYPLPDMTDNTKDMYKFAAILLFPLLWGGYGVLRLLNKK